MSSNPLLDKPEGKKLGWEVVESGKPFASKRFTVRDDKVVVAGAPEPVAYAYAERAAGVIIVPVTSTGEIILVRQYRYPIDAWCLETPAGSTADTGDMPLDEVVRKELVEEIGATAQRLERVSQFFSAPAYCTERCVVFIAWEAELAGAPEPEPTEEIKIEIVSAAEALRRAESGEMENGVCALALCHCRRALQAAGFL